MECVVALRHYEWTKVRTNTLYDSDGECHHLGNLAIFQQHDSWVWRLENVHTLVVDNSGVDYTEESHGCVAHVTPKLSLLGCYVPARVQGPVHNLYRAHSTEKRFYTKFRGKKSV